MMMMLGIFLVPRLLPRLDRHPCSSPCRFRAAIKAFTATTPSGSAFYNIAMQVALPVAAVRPGGLLPQGHCHCTSGSSASSSAMWPFIALQIIGLLFQLFVPDIAVGCPGCCDDERVPATVRNSTTPMPACSGARWCSSAASDDACYFVPRGRGQGHRALVRGQEAIAAAPPVPRYARPIS